MKLPFVYVFCICDDILSERVKSSRIEKGLDYIVKKQEYEERTVKLHTK
jgi:hypothetical protein